MDGIYLRLIGYLIKDETLVAVAAAHLEHALWNQQCLSTVFTGDNGSVNLLLSLLKLVLVRDLFLLLFSELFGCTVVQCAIDRALTVVASDVIVLILVVADKLLTVPTYDRSELRVLHLRRHDETTVRKLHQQWVQILRVLIVILEPSLGGHPISLLITFLLISITSVPGPLVR